MKRRKNQFLMESNEKERKTTEKFSQKKISHKNLNPLWLSPKNKKNI
jgi:hypothetical protein